MKLELGHVESGNLLFLDFDGVCNSFEHGSYLTHEPNEYGYDPEIVDRIVEICSVGEARVVISSNWRRYAVDGCFEFDGKYYENPLKKLYDAIECLVVGTLPKDRHITKSQALELWFEDNPRFGGRYAVVDDNPREGFMTHPKFKDNFWLTNPEYGITQKIADEIERHLKG